MDDRRRDGGTNSTLRTKKQGKHLTLNEHDDDDDDDNTSIKSLMLGQRSESDVTSVKTRNRVLVVQLT